jgi:hypothetical protein
MAKAILSASIEIVLMMKFQELVKKSGMSMSAYIEQLMLKELRDKQEKK